MPIFETRVKCFLCDKTGRKDEFLYDPKLNQYFCCEEHRIKSCEMRSLLEKAQERGLTICSKCLREIKPDAFVCKHCGAIRIQMQGYDVGKMCPFTISQIGSTQFGSGEYVWQLQRCIQEYCALWDFNSDCCSLHLSARARQRV
jgi:hypothetical protein